jgi:hypothetical protein
MRVAFTTQQVQRITGPVAPPATPLPALSFQDVALAPERHERCNKESAEEMDMRTENSSEMSFTKLDRVMKNQKRLFVYNIVLSAVLVGGLVASVASLL